ncbi:MAG: L-2-amino-thiazoline-4-carboxylic acid hydrolase [Pseudomonadota bacterium]
MSKTDLPILEQRRIEANIIKPIYEEMKAEIGDEKARKIISAAIIKNAIEHGAAYAKNEGGTTSLQSFHALLPQWKANGALEVDMLEETESTVSYNVTRCQYAEMYKEMGLADIGHLLSCGRDGTFCKGYDPRISLVRTQTIMQGATHCDFRYSFKDEQA